MGIHEDIALMEEKLHELTIKYEQYFLGMEPREPIKLLDALESATKKYRNVAITNTMIKFKYNSLMATFQTHKQKWLRTTRLIEEGKYSRDRFKMEMRDGLRQFQPPPPQAARLDPEVEQLYLEYIRARKACNLPVSNISPAMIAAAIEKQKPVILSKHGCAAVVFNVVIEEGRPTIKARPKK